MAFVRAWSKATGREQSVPEHFFDNPVLSRDLTRENPNPPEPEVAAEQPPSLEWTRAELDAYAEAHAIDTTGASNKGEVLAAITAHIQTQQQNTITETPAAGENQE